jgi:hypothetical protein
MSADPLADVIREARKPWGAGDVATDFDHAIAAAVRAHLAGDVLPSDEAIAEAVEQGLYPGPTYRLDAIAAVRTLLADTAARARAAAEAERDEARAEVERLADLPETASNREFGLSAPPATRRGTHDRRPA